MGLIKADLCGALGAPLRVSCAKCKKSIATRFDEYDVTTASFNPRPGAFQLEVYCHYCTQVTTVVWMRVVTVVVEAKK